MKNLKKFENFNSKDIYEILIEQQFLVNGEKIDNKSDIDKILNKHTEPYINIKIHWLYNGKKIGITGLSLFKENTQPFFEDHKVAKINYSYKDKNVDIPKNVGHIYYELFFDHLLKNGFYIISGWRRTTGAENLKDIMMDKYEYVIKPYPDNPNIEYILYNKKKL